MNMFRKWRASALSFSATFKWITGRDADEKATVVLRQFQVKATYRERFTEALRKYIASSLKEAGNIMAVAHFEQGDPSVLWVIERWSNRSSYKNSQKREAAAIVASLARTGSTMAAATIFLRDIALVCKEKNAQQPISGEQPFIVMLFVDVKKGAVDEFKSINREALPSFREEAGLLTFQLSQRPHHKSRFVVYKKFHNSRAFQNHLKSPAAEPLMKFLQHSVKKPPFEKRYHHLIELAP